MKRFVLIVALLSLLPTLMGCGPKDAADSGAKFSGKVASTMDEALQLAKSGNMPILLVAHQGDFAMIERNLLNDMSIKERQSKFVTVNVNTSTDAAAVAQLNITQYPAVLILKSDGTEAWRGGMMPMPGQVAQALDAEIGKK